MTILNSVPTDIEITGSITAVNQSIILPVNTSMSAWTVEVDGTWVGNLVFEYSVSKGVRYIPVNSRQTLLGRITNNTSISGVFRGAIAGATHFRVRSTSWTSGTANIIIRASFGVGAVFINSIVEVRNLEQYYASNAGGNVAFSGTVDAVTIPSGGGTVAILNNPSNSGVDAYISKIVVGTNKAGRFRRFRLLNNPTITGADMPTTNKGANTNIAKTKLYTPANATVTGGLISKTIFVPANGSDSTDEGGSSILRPGQTLYWTYIQDANQEALATVDVSFWESVAAT